MHKRRIISAMLGATMLFSLAACSSKTEETTELTTTSETTAAPTTEEETTTTEEEVIETTVLEVSDLYDPSNPNAVNPVTGVQDMDPANVGKRIVGISVNNYYEALPQRGVSQADAIYEFETEAGKTRFVALFADVNKVPLIGSLRSARYMSTDICRSLNAVFIHWGGNKYVINYINESNVDHVEGNNCAASFKSADENGQVDLPKNTFFWRNQDWKSRSLEHTGVSNGTHILEAIEHYNIDLNGESPLLFNFTKAPSKNLENAGDCAEINVVFSQAIQDCNFKYDPTTNLYMKSAKGKPQIDETTGEQIGFTNVVVLYCDIHQKDIQPDLRDATFTDGGEGWYVSNGKIVKITWDQETKDDPFKLYAEDGSELCVNIGKSYICIVDNDVMDQTTITETAAAEE